MRAVAELAPQIGMRSACDAFALNRGFVYRDRARHRAGSPRCVPHARPRPPLALSGAEQEILLGVLDSERPVRTASRPGGRSAGQPEDRCRSRGCDAALLRLCQLRHFRSEQQGHPGGPIGARL